MNVHLDTGVMTVNLNVLVATKQHVPTEANVTRGLDHVRATQATTDLHVNTSRVEIVELMVHVIQQLANAFARRDIMGRHVNLNVQVVPKTRVITEELV